MGRTKEQRRERYHMLKRAGFNSREATVYKEYPFERIVRLCEAKQRHQAKWKEELTTLVNGTTSKGG